jgi:hypothetical protein
MRDEHADLVIGMTERDAREAVTWKIVRPPTRRMFHVVCPEGPVRALGA